MEFPSNTSEDVLIQANETVSFGLKPAALQVYNVYLYLMIVLGVSGNSLVLIVFTKHTPSTTTDWFILFITTCDFITSLINVPVYATFTNGLWKYIGNNVLCKVHMFISQSLVLSSAFLICGLALDRYIKVCRPMTSFSKARARTACFLISLITTLLSIPCLVLYEHRQGRCLPATMDTRLFVYYLLVFLTFVFSTGVVVYSYMHVARTIRNSERIVASHNTMNRSESGKKSIYIRKLNRVMPYSTTLPEPNVMPNSTKVMPYSTSLPEPNVMPYSTSLPEPNVMPDSTKVMPYSTTLPEPNVIAKDDHAIRSKVHLNPMDSKETKNVQANNTFVLAPKRNMSGPGTSPSTSYKDRLQQTISLGQTSRTTAAVAERQTHRRRDMVSLRTTRIAFTVCTLFIVTWIPPWASFILSTIPKMNRNNSSQTFMLFGRMTYLINNMTNPILYTWLNRKFRKNILEIIRCH